ncbi:MAG: thiamine-phosphate kinase [Planctomycetia bacterium]|nr:thiamine-phosphate kinase [Planctomycetia bacterium]
MELKIVEKLCHRFPNHPALKLGPGDDAAIMEIIGSSPEIVVSTDLLTEGVDFLLERMNPRKIGRKALAVNLSDLAAMAAEPLACVISVALPRKPRFPVPEDFTRINSPMETDFTHSESDGTPLETDFSTQLKTDKTPAETDFSTQSKTDYTSAETIPPRGIFLPRDQKPTGTDTAQLMEFLCDGFLDAVYETAHAGEKIAEKWKHFTENGANVSKNSGIIPKNSENVSENAEKIADFPRIATIPTAIAGGDTNFWDGPLVISVTVIGKVREKPLCRHHARPGDAIFVTGPLGGSILRRQFNFMPRIPEMLALNQAFPLSAGMDISDGLTLDLARLCQRSKCRAELFLDEIPIHTDARTLAELGTNSELETTKSTIYDWIPTSLTGGTALEHALGDGEDFEVLFTVPWELSNELRENQLGIPVYRIGRMLESHVSDITDSTENLILGSRNGSDAVPIPIRGFQHG